MWSRKIPKEKGAFWFYGQLFSIINENRLEIIRVRKISNGFLYYTTSTFNPKEAVGTWMKIDEPELPDLESEE